jgi:hypothetical protein
MIKYSHIFNQKAKNGYYENISKVESLKNRLFPNFLVNNSEPPAAVVVEKPTEVEYKPVPEFDKK